MDCFTSWFSTLFHWPIYTFTVTTLSRCGLIKKLDISKEVPTMFLFKMLFLAPFIPCISLYISFM